MTLASIPSPTTNSIEVFGLEFNFYGIAIALGVIAAIVVGSKMFEQRGGDPKLFERAAVWGVAAGLLGARAGYVITHSGEFTGDDGNWYEAFFIWEGGLALFGGLLAGTITVLWIMNRNGADLGDVADSAAVGIPLAQAIGRWGNYFNQELYGKPSDLPWALEIDPENRVADYTQFDTFHPTFLYESLANFALFGFLLWLNRRYVMPRWSLFFIYFAVYGTVRFLLELLRIDTTYRLLGISRNGWIGLGVAIAGYVLTFVWLRRTPAVRRDVPTATP